MKKLFLILIVFFISVSLFGNDFDLLLELDFNAPQNDLPYPQYVSVYLVNTTEFNLTFNCDDLYCNILKSCNWMGFVQYFSRLNQQGSFAEIIFERNLFNETHSYILSSGEKVRIFSAGFSNEDKRQYPYSYLAGNIFVNGQEKKIRAYINPHLFR